MKATVNSLHKKSAAALLAVTISAATASYGDNSVLTDSEKQELKILVLEFYQNLSSEQKAANKLYEMLSTMPDEEFDSFIDNIPDPKGMLRNLRNSLDQGGSAELNLKSNTEIEKTVSALQDIPFAQIVGFPPDYPLVQGAYLELIQRTLASTTQFLPNGKTASELSVLRCDAEKLAKRQTDLIIARATADALQASCAGLDGVPFASNAVCSGAAVADGVFNALQGEFNDCDFHIGNIDSAELEATFENSKLILGQVNNIGANIDIIESTILNSFNTLSNKTETLINSANQIHSTTQTIDGKANQIQNGINTLNNKADTLQNSANTLISNTLVLNGKSDQTLADINILNTKANALQGTANSIESKVDDLNDKADLIDNKISHCQIQITMDSQSPSAGASGDIRFFILTTLHGNRIEPENTAIWVGTDEVVPVAGTPETLIPGVQKVELDRNSIPAGRSTPMTVDVSISPDNNCSTLAMIQRGNP